jgi:hypothetical protein
LEALNNINLSTNIGFEDEHNTVGEYEMDSDPMEIPEQIVNAMYAIKLEDEVKLEVRNVLLLSINLWVQLRRCGNRK